jgi:hypothetical protein
MTGGFQMNYRDELDEAADTPRARAAGTLCCEAMVAPGDNQGDRPTRLPSRSKGCPDYPELAASEWQDFLFVGTYRSERFVLKLVDIVSIDVGQSHAQALTILKIPKLKRPWSEHGGVSVCVQPASELEDHVESWRDSEHVDRVSEWNPPYRNHPV